MRKFDRHEKLALRTGAIELGAMIVALVVLVLM